MVVYEEDDSFVMTEQHAHAILSEDFAQNWKVELFLDKDKRDSVLYAIAQHDRSWINLDESPIWNDNTNEPYTFNDFPISIKLDFYRKGLNEIEEQNLYAALLCSIHYTGFFPGEIDDNRIIEFIQAEQRRQKRLLKILDVNEADKNFIFHYNLLKFCDNISLFVCMQEAGATGLSLHNWFKKGLAQPFSFYHEDTFKVEWKSEEKIIVHPYPFKGEFEVEIPLRKVQKAHIKEKGILGAFHDTRVQSRTVKIIPN